MNDEWWHFFLLFNSFSVISVQGRVTKTDSVQWKAMPVSKTKQMRKRTISNAYIRYPRWSMKKINIKNTKAIQNGYVWKAVWNFFLACHFFMHMLNISILLMQSIRNLQYKLWYKLISMYMHKQNPYLKANRKKMAYFKKLLFCKKNICFWHRTSLCNVQWVYIV